MWVEFKFMLRRLRGAIIGWSLGLVLYSLMMVVLYKDMVKIDMNLLLEYYPKDIMKFFGDSITALSTPSGYLEIYFFNYMPVVIGIFAVSACAAMLAGSEERGHLDLILAHPISRSALFWGRVLAFGAALGIILGTAWLTWVIPADYSELGLSWLELLQPFLPLAAVLLLFGGLTLVLSLLLPSARMGSMIAGGLLVANYLMVGLSNINEDLKAVVDYTPLHFYQGGKAIDGLEWGWLVGLSAVSVILLLISWQLFQNRDLRVGGEGDWHWGR